MTPTRLLFVVALVLLAVGAPRAQTVTLTASPSTAISPADISLTWSTAGFPAGATIACLATGGWSGTKAASGTQTVTAVTSSQTYSLSCSGGIQSASITWTPPTTNTDGTPVNLASYRLYRAATAGAVSTALPATQIPAPASAYTATNLPAGQHCFGLTAVSTAGVASLLSNVACKDIAVVSASAAASVTVNAQPNPPGAVTVGVVVGMNMSPVFNVTKLGKLGSLKGFVPAGVPCTGDVIAVLKGAEFRAVARNGVQWWGSVPSEATRLAAACG